MKPLSTDRELAEELPAPASLRAGEQPGPLRKLLHRFIPANFHNVFGLTWRLLWQGKPAGRVAMLYSGLGLLLTPLDLLLQLFERRRYRAAAPPELPQIFVCGAARSGTTLTAQVLIKYLPVFYFNNLTSLFPRSPITALKLFGRRGSEGKTAVGFDSFYGRTSRLSAPNDALYFWDRWVGHDRSHIPQVLLPGQEAELVHFFGAMEDFSGKPLLNKNNSLNTYAHLVAPLLPNAYFICLDRDPLYLAQSHWVARRFIHGDEHVAYGIGGELQQFADPVEDICRQVLFHRQRIQEMRQLLGEDRFIILDYEDFCARPAEWVQFFSKKILGQELDLARLKVQLPPFKAANRRTIDEVTFQQMEATLQRLAVNTQTL